MMDKRVLKIILVMVCSTFAMLAVAVGIRLYLRADANYVPDQIKRADTFVERGQRDRAAEFLLELKNRHPNSGQRQQIDNRLAELNDAVAAFDEACLYCGESLNGQSCGCGSLATALVFG